MDLVKELLQTYSNLKVIHLVRDPRAMFSSQFRSFLVKPVQFNDQFKEVCSRMIEDAAVTKRLIESGNKNIRLLRYEDLANNPFNVAKELYKFIGQPFTANLQKYVIENTSANKKDNCMFCTRRGNSSLTASKWRERVRMPFVKIVNRYCQEIYSIYGYAFINSLPELRNPNFHVVKDMIPLKTR